ncbi:Thiol-disulfide isomerase or thioredoxin [Singulisphaera sp. GP187]|uniref:TlpA disulfide reductase family protein n=1 Tax=Singulisphaera sp. GP187 TaxID=1882752 RepID=UPI00092BF3D8|nr:TlpA disulfide reductase family protein [Singulisphaera sp. GP187]SIO59242.1 Thiol-disulfide isomerase or thioredoxin [Singulisphaera sp. GP187]
MNSILRASHRPLLGLALALAGCGESSDPSATPAPATNASTAPTSTPSETAQVAPAVPTTDASPAPEKAEVTTPAETDATSKVEVAATAGAAKLEPVKFDEFLKRVANKNAKFTLVDVWASWCIPCKENFPHLVEMNAKFADKGLSVASLSFDDPAEPKQVKDAIDFLTAKKAAFPNYLLDEEQGVGYEKLNIGAIPAVFIYGPDGKEVKRYTMDDPNNQFTYEEVEKDVMALLDGKPLPKDEKSKPAEK